MSHAQVPQTGRVLPYLDTFFVTVVKTVCYNEPAGQFPHVLLLITRTRSTSRDGLIYPGLLPCSMLIEVLQVTFPISNIC